MITVVTFCLYISTDVYIHGYGVIFVYTWLMMSQFAYTATEVSFCINMATDFAFRISTANGVLLRI